MIKKSIPSLLLLFFVLSPLFAASPGLALSGFTMLTPDGARVPYDGGAVPTSPDPDIETIVFTTSFTLTESWRTVRPSLLIDPSSYPFEIFVNDRLVATRGQWEGELYVSVHYDPLIVALDPSALFFDGSENTVEIRIYPSEQVNPLFPVTLLPFIEASARAFYRTFFNLTLVQASFVLSIIIGMYFMFLWFRNGRTEIKYLFVALFITSYAFCYINMAFAFDSSNPHILEKISRTCYPVSLLFLFFFLSEHTGLFRKSRFSRIVKIVDAALLLPISIAILIQKSQFGVAAVFDPVMTYYIFPNLLLCLVLTVVAVIRSRFRSHVQLLVAILLVFGAAAHDIYYVMNFLTPYTYLLIYGFLALVLIILFMISGDQAKSHRAAVEKTRELDERNHVLDDIMAKIRGVTQSLVQSTGRLDSIAGASLELVHDYEKGNQLIQDTILSRFSEMETSIGRMTEGLRIGQSEIAGALKNQGEIVSGVSSSIGELGAGVSGVRNRAEESSAAAARLAEIASGSSGVVEESRKTLTGIADISSFILGVLQSINDISEETNILSINAAIEAARSGTAGRGFKIVADNIRSLSAQTKTVVNTSFQKLKRIDELVEKSNKLSASVSGALGEVIAQSKTSAEKIGSILDEIRRQETGFRTILASVTTLRGETDKIDRLSEEDAETKEDNIRTLAGLKETFLAVSEKIRKQTEAGASLLLGFEELRSMADKNAENVSVLETIIAGTSDSKSPDSVR